jgi:uncharacterized protein YlaI
MPIRFRCQDCRSRVKVPEGSQGKQVKCPRCGRIQSVPNRQGKGRHNPPQDDLSVHTLVGSMHKAPKRKESLVSPGVDTGGDSDDRLDGYRRGGGTPGGLDLPSIDELDQSYARDTEQDEAAESKKIEDSRRRVQDLFATSHSQTPEADEPTQASQALSLNGASPLADTEPSETLQETQAPSHTGWTVDLSAEAYPFLKLVPWVLRLAAVMLIGLAFKAMLLADEQGYSFVVCMLVLFAGFTMVAVTWTVGEIARAVRDIALKRTLV